MGRDCAPRSSGYFTVGSLVVLAVGVLSADALAQPAESADRLRITLSAIDAVLATASAQRVEPKKSEPEGMGAHLCEGASGREPGAANRDFLCSTSTSVGRWTLKNFRADGGGLVSAYLEARSFSSVEQARAAKVTALERYGGAGVSIHEGAISWCFLDVFWTKELLFSLCRGGDTQLRAHPTTKPSGAKGDNHLVLLSPTKRNLPSL